MNKLYIFLFIALFVQCMNNEENLSALPGDIVVSGMANDINHYYRNSRDPIHTFENYSKDSIDYSFLSWFGDSETFLGIAQVNGKDGWPIKRNLVLLDTSGKPVRLLHEMQEGEMIMDAYSSGDSLIAITYYRNADPEESPLENLTPALNLIILDTRTNKLILNIDDIGQSPNFDINENPWLMDGSGLLYSINGETKFYYEPDTSLLNPVRNTPGIYKLSLNEKRTDLIIPDANEVICSPADNVIAYVRDGRIYTRNLDSRHEEKLMSLGSKDRFYSMHWTPDGKSLYIAYKRVWIHKMLYSATKTKLIDIKTKKARPFHKIGASYNWYTWR